MADTIAPLAQTQAPRSSRVTPRLSVRHGCTRHGDPLAVIDGLPDSCLAELTPPQLRGLAAALLRVADDCEGLPVHRDRMRNLRTYALGDATRREVRDVL